MALLGATGLFGCSSSKAHSHETQKLSNGEQPIRRLDYSIEQNALGEFVFCKTGECLQTTPKIIDEPTVQAQPNLPVAYFPSSLEDMKPQAAAFSAANTRVKKQKKILSGSLKVSFPLGSSRLGAVAVKNLKGSLPKLIQAETIHIRGWADSQGGKRTAINNRLAQERAKKIRLWLVERKVPPHRIKLSTKPACCNRNDSRTALVSWASYRSKG